MASIAPLSNSTNGTKVACGSVTKIPSNLEDLPTEELVRLAKRVATERDEEIARSKKKPKASAAVAAAAAPAFSVKVTKKRIQTTVTRVVKKAAHNNTKKPWSEVNEMVPSVAAVQALFEGYAPKSDTSRMTKWELHGSKVNEWLDSPDYIHPVKFGTSKLNVSTPLVNVRILVGPFSFSTSACYL